MEQQIQTTELQITQAKQAAEFALTPVGQIVKQFEVMQRMAKMYTESTIVPETYKGNVGNCVIAIDMATRMGVNSLMVMQNLYIVKGNPSWSSKFLIATINMSGKYSSLRYRKRSLGKVGKIKYSETVWDNVAKRNTIVVKEFDGTDVDNIECIAYATELSTGETLESDPITIETAIKEGWYTKTGSKWVTMPSLMLTYRAAAFWQRMYCPEISMGFLTKEEADDIQDVEYESGNRYIYLLASERAMNPAIVNDDSQFAEYLKQTEVTSKAIRWGNEQEADARNLYAEISGLHIVEVGSCKHPTIPHFASSPDGFYYDENTGIKSCLEIKCPNQATFMRYKNEIYDNASLLSVKYEYFYQCMAHMMCTGAKEVYFIAYNPYQSDPIHIVRILPDEKIFAEMDRRIRLANDMIDKIIN